MGRVPRADQLKLLEIADIDAHVAQLTTKLRKHPARSEIEQTNTEIAMLHSALENLTAQQADVEAKESELAKVASELSCKVAQKEAQLQTGAGMDSRQLLALQHEIELMRVKANEISDQEYEQLESAEAIASEISSIKERLTAQNEQLASLEESLKSASDEIGSRIADARTQREQMYAPLALELRQAYDEAKASGGLAVVGISQNGQSTAGIQVSPTELDALKSADPNSLFLLEEYECIAVLLDH